MAARKSLKRRNLFVLVFLTLSLFYLTTDLAQAVVPTNSRWVCINGSGDYYPSIRQALANAVDGDVIDIYPGTYEEYGLTISHSVTLQANGHVKWWNDEQLFTLNTHGVTFIGISFKINGNDLLADMNDYNYTMQSCTLRCNNFDFGQGISHWVGCCFFPKSLDGWAIIGPAQVQMRNCKLGDDMPLPGEVVTSLNLSNDAHLAAYYCTFQGDSGVFYVNASKLNIFYSMLIGNKAAAIRAVAGSEVSCIFSTFECQDPTDTYSTIMLEDSSFGHFNINVIRNLAPTPTTLSSFITQTTDSVLLIDNNFTGTIELNDPPGAYSGPIKFYGHNTITRGGVDDNTAGISKKIGNALKMHAYGDTCFAGTLPYKIVCVNGMPASAVITVTYKNPSAVQIGDVVVAVEVFGAGGFFTVRRSSENNTSDLWFYWSADWEEDE